MGADRHRYSKLLKDLENGFTQRRGNYPKMLVDAYSLLVHWKQDPRNLMRVLGTSNNGMAFTNIKTDKTSTTSLSTLTSGDSHRVRASKQDKSYISNLTQVASRGITPASAQSSNKHRACRCSWLEWRVQNLTKQAHSNSY
jgi:hypothetical protein